jgi:cation diffusion facilitator family transporter
VSQKINIRVQIIALSTGIVLMGIKFVAYFLTHSNAILSDALESIINVVAGGFALYSLILAAKPRDADHPYGHGKVEFLSAGFEGSLILFAGVSIIIKAIYGLLHPQPLNQLDVGILLTAFAGGINFLIGWVMERRGRNFSSITLEAGGKHLKSDAYSTIGLLIGLLVIFLTGIEWLDSVFAILFGVIIIFTGLRIVRRSVAGIMDEADEDLVVRLVEVLEENRRPEWIDIHNLRVIKYGSYLHVDCHVTLPWYFSLEEAHKQVEAIELLVKESFYEKIEFFIHSDPCLPFACKICALTNCQHRKNPFENSLKWTPDLVKKNSRHGN